MGVVGFLRPRVLVSAGALLRLDDDELAAALAHERAHISRRHRYWLTYGSTCAAIGRVLPGTRTALDELGFHLERDADRSALAGHVDREALVAALRKASEGSVESKMALALGGSRMEDRVEEILSDAPARRTLLWPGLAALLVALVLGSAATVPAAMAAGFHHPHESGVELDCD
jgi:beta-lactamase regulating signal transducer with metallopeptidase domain